MLIFKFGGASVKDSGAVKNIVEILKNYKEEIVVVVSAMGKTTNALERIIESYVQREDTVVKDLLVKLKEYHYDIVRDLFADDDKEIFKCLEKLFGDLEDYLQEEPAMNYDFVYDQIIGYGELLSTRIVAAYLQKAGLKTRWMDVRKALKTDDTFREARINWEVSAGQVREQFVFNGERCLVTQGFLASNNKNMTTSLGREGSDFTAAVLAHILRADSVTIWKDVPGVLNADPKYFDDTILIDKLSYLDAIELAYYGTGVIHPKTIKPLQNKNINLYVKSFLDPASPGTVIGNFSYNTLVPSFIFKMDQVLIRISPHDFSFIEEDNLQKIYGVLHDNGLKINLQQTSAVSFQVVVSNDKRKVRKVVDELEEFFKVSYETGLELVTIRYFDEKTIERVMINKSLLLEQRGVQNIQLLIRDLGG